ncbi:N-acetylmuramoyl-L-alanine amidase, partial [uncultured Thomasclavelia sp.]|uniref:N-acetylmuramoyl-L-alanine amidase n=1 Tax=uncultured Thomasclavelia sp. TaxID=3025759 RepID=UPI0025976E48
MKIAIDAGHGRYTAGKRCSKKYDSNETREWVLNSRVASYVQNLLKEYGVSTIRLDDITGAVDISLGNRCKTANSQNVDLVVSIHHNAGGGNGLETFVYNGSKLPQRTIDIAQTIHNACIESTGQRNRTLKRMNLAICRDTDMDALLVEGGFMDNAEDTPRILTDEFAQKYARGIVNGIVKYYGLKKNNSSTSSQTTSTTAKPSKNNYTGGSIVDYLNSIGVNSSFDNRKKLAQENGIKNYTGTASQNTALLNKLRGNKATTTTTSNTSYYSKYNGSSSSLVDALKSLGI